MRSCANSNGAHIYGSAGGSQHEAEKNPWMLHFEGHHLAVNVTIDGPRGTLTPTLRRATRDVHAQRQDLRPTRTGER